MALRRTTDGRSERLALVAYSGLHAPPAVDDKDLGLPWIQEELRLNGVVEARIKDCHRRGLSNTAILAEVLELVADFPMPINSMMRKSNGLGSWNAMLIKEARRIARG